MYSPQINTNLSSNQLTSSSQNTQSIELEIDFDFDDNLNCQYQHCQNLPNAFHDVHVQQPYYTVYATQGNRKTMQDYFSVSENSSIFGIYDGFGGQKAAEIIKDHLPNRLARIGITRYQQEMTEIYEEINNNLLSNFQNEGSCILTLQKKLDKILIANLGDSRAYLITSQNKFFGFKQLTKVHNFSDQSELDLVQNKNGPVMYMGGASRLMGQISVSRFLGAHQYSQYISIQPHISQISLSEIPKDGLIIMGSDGLWNQIGIEEIQQKYAEGHEINAQYISSLLGKGYENVTIMVLKVGSMF